MLQELNVISAFRRIFSLKKDVRMRVNQSGKYCELCRKVDDGCIGRRSAAVIDALNPVAANDDQHVVARLRGNAVNERGGTDGDDFFGAQAAEAGFWANRLHTSVSVKAKSNHDS